MNQDINLTNAAAEYLRELILNGGGSPLTFLCLAVGDGKLDPGVESTSRTSLVHEVHRMPVETITKEENGRVYITARLSTDILHSDFKQRELGIYVRTAEGELLLGYVNYGENYDYIPAPGGTAAVYKTITAAFDVMNLRTTFRDLPSDDLVSFTAFNTRLNEVIPIFVNEEFTAAKEEIEESVSQAESIARDAQTSASQALESANAASGHAMTTGINATQAETSAANAADSEFKAKASETAAGISASSADGSATMASTKATQAGTSATQAANSASAAQGHASTASTKATQAAGSATSAATSATQAGMARDGAVTAKTAAEAAADRAEAASSGGITDAQVNTKISTHNTSAAAHSVEMSKKLDKPTGGTVGQVLTKTTTGTAWSDAAGGGGSESTYKLNAINDTTAEHGVRHTHGHVTIEMLSMHTGSMEYPEWRLAFTDADGGTDNQIVMSGGIGISTNDGSLSAYTSINGNVMDIGHDIVINGKFNASSPSVDIISGSSITLVNDSYVGLEVSSQGDTIISGNTLTLKSGDLTKTLEDLMNEGSSGGSKPAYMYSKSYNSGPDGKWEQLCAKNPPNGVYKVYIEAGGLHAPDGISITPSEILTSVTAQFTSGAAYGTASDGSEVVTNLVRHEFEHVPNIGFSHISYINVQFIYKKDADGLQFLLSSPGYVPTHEIDITVIMIPLTNDYTPL